MRVRLPVDNKTKAPVMHLGIEDGAFKARLAISGTVDKRLGSFIPPQYKVDLTFHPARDLAEWQRRFKEGANPPLPDSWKDNCWACCTCPEFNNGPLGFNNSTPDWWCKHVYMAFFIIRR